MATRKFTQNNFTQGQVGPYLLGRGDTPIYKAGLEICENMICLPQGGIQKRKGFKFISANPDSSTTPDGSTTLTTGSVSGTVSVQAGRIPVLIGSTTLYIGLYASLVP